MFGGGRGGGFDPAQLQQMMQQFGIDMTDIDATSVRIETADGEVLVFNDPEVTRMDAQGQQTYQIIGEPETQEAEEDVGEPAPRETEIPDSDVELVMTRTNVSEDAAREALTAADGDLAAAIAQLE